MPGSWNMDPSTVDGYRFGGLPWPVETMRYAYVTLLGGFSAELPADAIGLNKQALEENTELEPGDRVTISLFERGRPVPLMVRPSFELVPLDFQLPDAYLQATDGEAVLAQAATEEHLPGLEEVASGIEIVINGVLAARMRGTSS